MTPTVIKIRPGKNRVSPMIWPSFDVLPSIVPRYTKAGEAAAATGINTMENPATDVPSPAARASNPRAMLRNQASLASIVPERSRSASVSYTHLDVYKRQGYSRNHRYA